MNWPVKKLMAIAVAMLISFNVYGVTVHFTISATVRGVTTIVFSEDVDISQIEDILNEFSWLAIDVISVSFGSTLDNPPIVVMTEKTFMASSGGDGDVPVMTFAARNLQTDQIEFLIGGYIDSNEHPRNVAYHGSTQCTVMFQ